MCLFVILLLFFIQHKTEGIPVTGSNDLTSRIIGGTDAPEGFAPHMVALVVSGHTARVFCGGSIISVRHVLTAAHCIDSVVEAGSLIGSLYGVVGSNRWNSTKNIVSFAKYINHPEWDIDMIKYDVGVLFMAEELALSDRVAVIELEFNWIRGGERSYVTGWGMMGPMLDGDVINLAPTPHRLQLLHVKTITSKECIRAMAEIAAQNVQIPPIFPQVEICTFHSVGHGMCNGDSGSALVAEATGRQIGVVSWGIDCTAAGAPDVFVRVSGVQDFLISMLQDKTNIK